LVSAGIIPPARRGTGHELPGRPVTGLPTRRRWNSKMAWRLPGGRHVEHTVALTDDGPVILTLP